MCVGVIIVVGEIVRLSVIMERERLHDNVNDFVFMFYRVVS